MDYSSPSIVYGFHGTEKKIVEDVLLGKNFLTPSNKQWDWLGEGIYFWEGNPHRAFEWALKQKKNQPYVVGAIIDLGNCLNLLEQQSLIFLKKMYDLYKQEAEKAGCEIPENKKDSKTGDVLRRDLDCAVINFAHTMTKETKEASFDTVRGVFWEGKEIYPGAQFKEKSHIQICVRNHNCIKGYFVPNDENLKRLMT